VNDLKGAPTNICILHFGQLGDVLLALPAIKAVRENFPNARLTLVAGKLAAGLVTDFEIVDETIAVDRVALLKGSKLRSIGKILDLTRDVRRRRFDLIIDLHSLYETNLLSFFSGAEYRLLANRYGRSLNWLSNFKPKPPPEDKSIHLADNYLAVLKPLGIERSKRSIRIVPDTKKAGRFLSPLEISSSQVKPIIGMIVGAGHPSRRWPIERFAELAQMIVDNEIGQIALILGPEEEGEIGHVNSIFPEATTLITGASLFELAAAFCQIDIVVSNDTGPPHLAALVGTPVVIVIDERGPLRYLPVSDRLKVVRSGTLDEIAVSDVLEAVRTSLAKEGAEQEEKPKKDQPD
jgi:ADP-heptose:LPS heptosyltransferase